MSSISGVFATQFGSCGRSNLKISSSLSALLIEKARVAARQGQPMAAPVSTPSIPEQNAHSRGAVQRLLCAVRHQRGVFPDRVFRALVDHRSERPRHPHRFRQRLVRRQTGARWPSGVGLGLGYPEAGSGRPARPNLCRPLRLALSAAVPVRRGFPRAVSLRGGVHRLGFGQPRALSGDDARDRRPAVRLDAGGGVSGGADQHAGRAERLSHRVAGRRHADPAADAADPGRHLPRAVELQAAIRPAVSAGADRGVAMDGVFHGGNCRGRDGRCVVARLRHRELAGVLSLAADVFAGLPHRRPRAVGQDAEHFCAGALFRRQRIRWAGRSSGP